MDRKSYVLSLLRKLEPYRAGFSDLIVNIELGVCDENDIEKVIQVIHTQIQNVKDVNLRSAFLQTKNILERIKYEEQIQRQKEEKELEETLLKIQNL